MKHLAPLGRLALGVVVSVAAASSWGLSIGRPQGVALIGRPLEVAVPLQFDPASESAPECAAVEVFYGDTRVVSERVSAEIQPGRSATTVRVRSTAPVNEPVVTLYLHIGCNSRLTRRVVMLSEQPDVVVEPATRPVPLPAMVEARPLPAPAAAASAPASTSGTTPRPPRGAPTPAPRPAAPARAPNPSSGDAGTPAAAAPATRAPESVVRRPRVAAAAPAPARAQVRDRLQLDDLGALLQGDPVLRMSTQLTLRGDTPPQQRAAAAAMWRALNASPEDILRDTQRIEALERDLRGLRASVQRNDAAVATLKTELERARSQRWANPLVYVLAVLALAAIAAAVWAWRRRSEGGGQRWWQSAGVAEDELGDMLRPAPVSVPAAPPAARHSSGRSVPGVGAGSEPSAPPSLPPVDVRPAEPSLPQHSVGFGDSMLGPRSLRAEEVRDIQQEADFFVSLGQHDRAIEVLRNHIAANPDTSAVAWLDLLEILHNTGKKQDFEWLREDFQRTFNVRVPPFESYSEGAGPGLEAYEQAMSRICALWPSRKVLDIIEDAIFRPPGIGAEPPFSLAAYRDLLMLHHLGQEVTGGPPSGAMPLTPPLPVVPDFSHTTMRPLSAAGVLPPEPAQAEEEPLPPISYTELDLNLDEPPPEPDVLIGGPSSEAGVSNLLDFDLPEIDTSAMRPKKTRE